ncbi:MAG: hypothetical protein K9G62_03535 [Alphaproteobacteria bacterium]|nr:hypothetical protein [Alphaproteobacteria bacterium]
MNKMLSALAVGLLLGASALSINPAAAEDAVAPAAEVTAETSVDAAVETKDISFANGDMGVIHGDHVYVSKMGLRTVAPDGDHALADGTTITVKDGLLVAPATTETAPAAGESTETAE